jgi:hypothetical protein
MASIAPKKEPKKATPEIKKKEIVVIYLMSEEPRGTFYVLPIHEFTPRIRAYLDPESKHDTIPTEEWFKIADMWGEKDYEMKGNSYKAASDEVIIEVLCCADWD